MKKFLAMVMTVAMVISMMTVVSFAAGEAAVITVGEARGKAGETINVPVYLKTTENANMAAIMLNSSSSFTFNGFTWDESIKSYINTSLSNVIQSMLYVNTVFNTAQTYDGIVGTFQLTLGNDVSGEIPVTLKTVSVKNNTTVITAGYVNGKIVVEEDAKYGLYDYAETEKSVTVKYNFKEAPAKSYTLYAAAYKAVNGAYELVQVVPATIAAAVTDGEQTATAAVTETADRYDFFLWDSDMNIVTVE